MIRKFFFSREVMKLDRKSWSTKKWKVLRVVFVLFCYEKDDLSILCFFRKVDCFSQLSRSCEVSGLLVTSSVEPVREACVHIK